MSLKTFDILTRISFTCPIRRQAVCDISVCIVSGEAPYRVHNFFHGQGDHPACICFYFSRVASEMLMWDLREIATQKLLRLHILKSRLPDKSTRATAHASLITLLPVTMHR